MYYKTIQMTFEISYRGRQLPFRGETIQLSHAWPEIAPESIRILQPEANLSPAGPIATTRPFSLPRKHFIVYRFEQELSRFSP